jgi:hypothetical protein
MKCDHAHRADRVVLHADVASGHEQVGKVARAKAGWRPGRFFQLLTKHPIVLPTEVVEHGVVVCDERSVWREQQIEILT